MVVAGVAFVGASLVISALQSHPRARAIEQPGPLVVVAMPKLIWSQVTPEATPTLWGLAQRGAVGALATRSPAGRSCSVQAWLMVSGGTPTDTGPGRCATVWPAFKPDGSASFADWPSWRSAGLDLGNPVDLGGVASILAEHGQCITAVGARAALGAANRKGVVAQYVEYPEDANLLTCPVTLIDLGHSDDTALASLIKRLPSTATIMVTGLALDGQSPTFQPVIIAGPGVSRGLLTSLSTRQPGVLQTSDISALLLSRLGPDAPIIGQGRPPMVRPVSGNPTSQVIGLVYVLDLEHPFVPWFFALFLGGSALALGFGMFVRRIERQRQIARGERPEMSRPVRLGLAGVAAMCSAMPVAVLLAGPMDWWQTTHPRLALSGIIVGLSAIFSVVALRGPWRRRPTGPFFFMISVTFFIFAQDVVHGSGLQFVALMGLQPVYGGRYYGQGNIGYAVFATAALLFATVVAGWMIARGQRRTAVAAVVFIGLFALVVDGSPSWGADGGGPIALAPAVGYLALKAGGERLTWRRVATTFAMTVALVGAFGLFDYLGPEAYRTHLGDFVAQVVSHEQWSGLTTIWTENWRMLTRNWFTPALPLIPLAIFMLARRPHLYTRPLEPALERVPFLKHGLRAIVICWVLAFLSNDSGTGIPPTGVIVLAPLLLLLATARLPEGARPNPVPAPSLTATESLSQAAALPPQHAALA
jgi:hypothetical protein